MGQRNAGKGQTVALAKQLIAGTEKRLANTTQVAFMGSSFTPAQITSSLQAIVNLRSDVDAANATAKEKLADEATQLPALRAFMSAFVSYVKVAFGTSPAALADFGVTPKARVPLTVEEKAAAAAKRAATRAARHTMGSTQKKGIKGAVTGVVVTPITAPQPTVTAPGSATTPATSGSSSATGAAATPRPA
jgi:hypothetical protein